jgi:hypothetical protein
MPFLSLNIEKPINPATFVAEIEQYLPADKTGNGLRSVHEHITHCG